MRKYALLFAGFLLSCGTPEQEQRSTKLEYFDLKGYFGKEAASLSRRANTVDKTVIVNDSAERKQVKITNWDKELSAFVDADINKAAWKGAFNTSTNKAGLLYTSTNEKVPVKRLQIFKNSEAITGIVIVLENSNYLYRSSDTLRYYPDSLYEIKKSQQIKLMSPKRYQITGRL